MTRKDTALLVLEVLSFSVGFSITRFFELAIKIKCNECFEVDLPVQVRIEFSHNQWRIQDFPDGAPTSKVGALTYYLPNFSRKLHENEKIGPGGARGGACVPGVPLDPPVITTSIYFIP